MVFRRIKEYSNYYTEEEIRAISETMGILNLRYFSGTENLNSNDVVNSEGFKLLQRIPNSFLKSYVMSIISDENIDDNSLHLIFDAN